MQIKAREGGRGVFDHDGVRVIDVKCPVRGCSKSVSAPNLQDNLAVAARLRRLERQQSAAAAGSGAGAGAGAGPGSKRKADEVEEDGEEVGSKRARGTFV